MPENQEGQAPEWNQQSVEKAAEALQPQQTDQHIDAPEPPEGEAEPGKVKEERVVPHGAFHAEREERKKAQARLREMEQQNAQLVRQQQEILQRLTTPQQPQQQITPYEQDPLLNIKQTTELTAQQVHEMRQKSENDRAESVRREQFGNFVNTVRAQAQEYAAEQPDANDAIGFLKQSRVNEYKAMGMGQQEAVQRMLKDEMDLAAWALQQGENPAKVARDMAISRGFVSPKQKLEMQREGQGASLPTGGGKSGGLPSLESLLKMDSKDFAKATSGDNWEKLLKKHA